MPHNVLSARAHDSGRKRSRRATSGVLGLILVVVFGALSLPAVVRPRVALAAAGSFDVPDAGAAFGWGQVCGSVTTGDCTGTPWAPPKVVPYQNNGVLQIASTGVGALAVHADGTLWGWGENDQGVLGDGTTTDRTDPVQIAGIPDGSITSVASDFDHSIALTQSGTVYAWGNNAYGQLGDGTTTSELRPQLVPGLSGVRAVAAGYRFNLALKSDGSLWAWGYNSVGQLGDGTTSNRSTPVQVGVIGQAGQSPAIASIAVGDSDSFAVMTDGTVYGWGDDQCGQLALGLRPPNCFDTPAGPLPITTPTKSPYLSGVSRIAGGSLFAVGLTQQGTVLAWGQDEWGDLGDGRYCPDCIAYSPITVPVPTSATAIAAGDYAAQALTAAGAVYGWGMSGDCGALFGQTNVCPVTQVVSSGAEVISDAGRAAFAIVSNAAIPGSGPEGSELWGDGNPGETGGAFPSVGLGVNPITGNLHQLLPELSVPGRGRALDFSLTYNSLDAAQSAQLQDQVGFGWTHSYAMHADVSAEAVTVHQENGSTITFTPGTQTGTWQGPPQSTATLFQSTAPGELVYVYTLAHQQSDTFEASTDRLLSESDRNGKVTSLRYNGNAQLTAVTDSEGRSLSFSYLSNGLLAQVTDQTNSTRYVAFTYDTADNLSQIRDVNGGITTYGYDTSHRITQLITAASRTPITSVQYSTDGTNRVASQALGGQTPGTWSLNYSGTTTYVTSPVGDSIVYQAVDNETTSYTIDGGTWTYGYDAMDNRHTVTDPRGNTWTYDYDTRGNVTKVTDPLQRISTTTYTPLNDPLVVTDPLQNQTTYGYDGNGNLASVQRTLNGATVTESYTYDPSNPGDLITKADPDGKVWRYSSDGNGMPASATDPLGDETTYSYDSDGFLRSSVSPRGNVTGGNPAQFTTTYGYDNLFGDVSTVTDPLGHQTITHRDAERLVTSTQDADSHTTTNAYDGLGHLDQSTRSGTSTITYLLDSDERVVGITDGGNRSTIIGYRPTGAVAYTEDSLQRTTNYSYDLAGNLVGVVDPQSQTTTLLYDSANQITAITYSDGKTPNVSFTYDADGRRATMVDGTGTTSYDYDSLGRLTSSTNGAGAVVSYGYDQRGNVSSIGYPGTGQETQQFDDAGRLAWVQDWSGHRTTFAYNADGRLTTETYGDGTAASYVRDNADRVSSITDKNSGGTSLLSFTYSEDPANLLASMSQTGVTGGSETYTYTPLNQLQRVNSGSFAYDGTGNLTTAPAITSLTYDGGSQLQQTIKGSTATTFGFDARGNRVSSTSGGTTSSYTYDQANRLATAAGATYTYNGDGLRMKKVVGHTTSAYVWNRTGSTPLMLQDGNASYIYGPGGLPVEQVVGTKTFSYYHQDQLGSTRALTSGGAVAATYSYDAYGNTTASTVNKGFTVNNPLQFAGQSTDAETGFQYLHARYYDPATAQFLTRDPAGVASGGNPYAYASGSPLNSTDPSGLCDSFVGCLGGFKDWLGDQAGWMATHPLQDLQAALDGAAVGLTVGLAAPEIFGEELATEGEASALAYPGGLGANDALGGHVLSHVGVSDSALATRGIPEASTFADRATAESALGDTLAANDSAIRSWLASGPSRPQGFGATFDNPIGSILYAGAGSSVPGTAALAVLRAAPQTPLGYFILTGYVLP